MIKYLFNIKKFQSVAFKFIKKEICVQVDFNPFCEFITYKN